MDEHRQGQLVKHRTLRLSETLYGSRASKVRSVGTVWTEHSTVSI